MNKKNCNKVGLFGYIGKDGKVKNLDVINVDVKQNPIVERNWADIGGIASVSYGIIENCICEMNVKEKSNIVGGIVSTNNGTVVNCIFEGNNFP